MIFLIYFGFFLSSLMPWKIIYGENMNNIIKTGDDYFYNRENNNKFNYIITTYCVVISDNQSYL
ncbi:hypothetical protein CKG00_10250 [Morganella morganii]|uniref:Uncharacterized protein n=1 Tax=Morganella morganii TaxID=582 RepID=A0A433ZX57_MORMO|nr:hypothetical protein CKG00_10250 [Morganella morganii]